MPTFLIFFAVAGFSAAPSPAAPQTLRVAILDCSGSMSTPEDLNSRPVPRIDIAREELRNLAQKLPPSPQHPLGLVAFSDTATARVYTNLASFERALDALQPRGGTAISTGLREAREILEQAGDATMMCVLLFTDGENQEPDGNAKVAREEAGLDRLFQTRHQQGLATHVVCKRWANTNSALATHLANKPHWGFLDAQDFQLTTVAVTPHITVDAVHWRDHDRLEIRLRGSTETRDQASLIGPLDVRCTNVEAEGPARVSLPLGAAHAVTFSITVPAPPQVATGGQGQLHFAVNPPAPQRVQSQVVLSTVAATYVVPFDVPARQRQFSVQATIKPLTTKWSDPAHRLVRIDAEVQLEVTATDGLHSSWPGPIHFLLEPGPDLYLVDGDSVLTVHGEGIAVIRASFTRTLAAHATEGHLSLQLSPQDAPTYFDFRPTPVSTQSVFPVPLAVTTHIQAIAGIPASGRWTELGQEYALFELPVTVSVQGPTSEGRFTVVAPPGIRDLTIEPSTLRTGDQTIHFRVEAQCPAQRPTPFRLELIPPASTDALTYQVADPIDITLIGPAPVQLVLAEGQVPITNLRIEISDTMDAYESCIATGFLDAPEGCTAHGVRAQLTTQGNLPFLIDPSAGIGQPLAYRFQIPPDHQQNFWADSAYAVTIDIVPDPPVTSIVGSTVVLEAVIPAPFKRWLFGALLVTGGIVLVTGVLWAIWRQSAIADEQTAVLPAAEPLAE